MNPVSQLIIDSKFDVSFGTFIPFERLISKRFDIPYVCWAAYLPDPPTMIVNK